MVAGLSLPAPWYSVELIELVEHRDEPPGAVRSLYLVDPAAEGGMRLLRFRPTSAPLSELPPPPADFEVIE